MPTSIVSGVAVWGLIPGEGRLVRANSGRDIPACPCSTAKKSANTNLRELAGDRLMGSGIPSLGLTRKCPRLDKSWGAFRLAALPRVAISQTVFGAEVVAWVAALVAASGAVASPGTLAARDSAGLVGGIAVARENSGNFLCRDEPQPLYLLSESCSQLSQLVASASRISSQ
jgi:hypothetical protein